MVDPEMLTKASDVSVSLAAGHRHTGERQGTGPTRLPPYGRSPVQPQTEKAPLAAAEAAAPVAVIAAILHPRLCLIIRGGVWERPGTTPTTLCGGSRMRFEATNKAVLPAAITAGDAGLRSVSGTTGGREMEAIRWIWRGHPQGTKATAAAAIGLVAVDLVPIGLMPCPGLLPGWPEDGITIAVPAVTNLVLPPALPRPLTQRPTCCAGCPAPVLAMTGVRLADALKGLARRARAAETHGPRGRIDRAICTGTVTAMAAPRRWQC